MSKRLRLVWGRLLLWMKPPRTLKITTVGWYFIALVFPIGLAAVNTGNNLLYLVLGAMLSFIVASGILSNMDLKGLSVTSHVPEHLFARTPALIRVDVDNKKRRIPSYLLVVEATGPGRSVALIGSIGPGARGEGFLELIFPRRGFWELSPLKVSTNFPFGLFTKGMEVPERRQVVVFPRIEEVDTTSYDAHVNEGESALTRSGQGSEPFSVTEFMPGDSPRHIHWKSTAKRGNLMRREFSREQEPRVTLVIRAGIGDGEAVAEEKIERAASLAARFITDGYAVGLACGGVVVAPAQGRDRLLVILRELALVDWERLLGAPAPLGDGAGMVIEV
jgi:uncharacterized protein (DUF58 family)